MTTFAQMSLEEIRSRRSLLQAQEDAVSFVRRLAQGRLDLARDEERRRASHDRSVNVESELAEVFGQEHGDRKSTRLNSSH